MEIIILGSACASCKKLEKNTREIVEKLGVPVRVTKTDDFMVMMSYGVVRTPAIAVNNKVILSGSVPDYYQLHDLLKKHLVV